MICIYVDTHVHRISNRLGWINTKNPNESRRNLENSELQNYDGCPRTALRIVKIPRKTLFLHLSTENAGF